VAAAHQRYAAALRTLAARHAGASVVLVTHGEAVRAAVRLADAGADAYAVEPCGFVALPTRRGALLAAPAAELRCRGVALIAAPPEDEGAEGRRGEGKHGGSSGRPPPEPEPSAPPL
jgi:DNA-binding response OmpR family regulator